MATEKPDLTEPENDAAAEQRFSKWEQQDPMPEIAPALLNSADIYAYALATGMLFPFPTDESTLKRKLKSASYEIDFLGDVYYKKDGKVEHKKIERETPFTLEPNSIAFVFIETKFRIPAYIALRFNLRITNVHRGLLLGTGPLVDPGFVGRLLVPLHNLTANKYTLYGGEGLIWVEFTKLSPHPLWAKGTSSARDYSPFPPDKRDLPAQSYFNKSSSGSPAESSIPDSMREFKETAATAKETAATAKKTVVGLTSFGIVGILFGLISVWSLIHDANKNIADFALDNSAISERLKNLEDKLKKLEAERPTVVAPVDTNNGRRSASDDARDKSTENKQHVH